MGQGNSEPKQNAFHIQCEICFKHLSATIVSRQPYVGSCGHSFCKQCADKVYGNCGVCRSPFIPVKNFSLIKLLEKMDGIKKKILEKKEKMKDLGIPVEDVIDDVAEEQNKEKEDEEDPEIEIRMSEEIMMSIQRMRLLSPQMRPMQYVMMCPRVREALEGVLDRLFQPFALRNFTQMPAPISNPLIRQAYEAHLKLQDLRHDAVQPEEEEVEEEDEEEEGEDDDDTDVPAEEDDFQRRAERFLRAVEQNPDELQRRVQEFYREMHDETAAETSTAPVPEEVQEVRKEGDHQASKSDCYVITISAILASVIISFTAFMFRD